MRCLIIGASGQVGGHLLTRCISDGHTALGTCHQTSVPELTPLDLCDDAAVSRLIGHFRPNVVFLSAALTHVDFAQSNPAHCFDINVNGTITVARSARACHSQLVFFSTDHVFGPGDWARDEDDPTAPMNIYSQSKVAGEDCVRAILPNDHLILRTSWVYGPERQGKNFVVRAIRTLQAGQELKVPRDQFGQPTYAPDLARVAIDMIARGKRGTYHAVGPDRMSRLDFGRLVAHVFGLDASLIRGVPTVELGQSGPRPLSIRLSREKFEREMGAVLRRPAQCLRKMHSEQMIKSAFEEPCSSVSP